MPENTNQDEITRSYAEAARLDAQAAEAVAAIESEGASAAEGATDALCSVWRRIRPIIVGASNLFFIPGNIRAALKILIQVVDGICPQ